VIDGQVRCHVKQVAAFPAGAAQLAEDVGCAWGGQQAGKVCLMEMGRTSAGSSSG
jgi:hypothetical protein